MLLLLQGCGSFVKPERTLPGPPAYAQPVEVADPQEGEDYEIVAARERAGRLKANKIIRATVRDWKSMKTTYSKGR